MIPLLNTRAILHVHLYVLLSLPIAFLNHSLFTSEKCLALAAETPAPIPQAAQPTTALIFHQETKQWIAAQGSELVVWDENCEHILRKLSTKTSKIHDLQFDSTETKLLVAGGIPGEIGLLEVYHWPTGEPTALRQIPDDTILRVHWSSTAECIAAASSTGRLIVLRERDLETIWQVEAHPSGCTSVQVFPDLGLVVSGGNDATIRIWGIQTGSPIRSLSQHTGAVNQLIATPAAFSETPQLVSISQDQTIRLWDPQSGRLIRFARITAVPHETCWERESPSKTPLLWVLGEDGRLRRIDLKTASIEQDIQGISGSTFALGQRSGAIFVTGANTQPNRIRVRAPLPRIVVAQDGSKFQTQTDGLEFRVRGFNYDHDTVGRLLEDYWNEQWSEVESDFCEMQELGANTIRVHLQFAKFMKSPTETDQANLAKFSQLVQLAERTRLYLDVTGLGCYHKADVPDWYDALDEPERWQAQRIFWQAIVKAAKNSPAIFCWDLMNEPVVPGGKRANREWLGPAFAGKHFVQFITLDQKNRPRPEIAKAWTKYLATAIRETGDNALITVGLVDWSLNRPGLTSGFEPEQVGEHLDFIAVHLYPKSDQLSQAAETLRGFRSGKPLIIEECFPLRCSAKELGDFLLAESETHQGWISFYWGSTPEELAEQKTISAAITREWLLHLLDDHKY